MFSRFWCVFLSACMTVIVLTTTVDAREIHVSTTGSRSGSGTVDDPLQTINQGAALAQPGDVVIVHGGIYREWVKPPRGGTSAWCSRVRRP